MGWFSSKSDPKFFLSTVPPEPGRVSEYLGVVSGEAVIGANLFRDMFASVRDVVGGRAGGYERALAGARQAALDEMVAAARDKGANGIVGIDFDYEVLGETNGMMMVAVSGTAVKIADVRRRGVRGGAGILFLRPDLSHLKFKMRKDDDLS